MHLKKMFAALLACLALGAVAAGSAQAEGTCWTIEGTCIAKNVHQEIKVSRHPGSPVLKLTAELLNKKLVLDATGIECSGICTIDNTTSPNHSEGKLKFTGVTVTEPANCTVHSPGQPTGTVVTSALTDTVKMDTKAGSTTVLDTFFPETGTKFAELEFTGELCFFEGLVVPVEGTVAGEAVHEGVSGEQDVPSTTGQLFVTQSLTFSQAVQETGGDLLYLSGNKAKPAYVDGTVDNVLTGTNVGKKWGSD